MQVQLTTLSPLHIGSGIQYQGNAEYLYFEKLGQVAIIDEAKVLDIIGIENIHIWVNYIENRMQGNFLDYLFKRKPGMQPQDIAKRVLPLKGRPPAAANTLREQIHSGLGKPYVPGSSLKGAVRTAIFATEMINRYKDGSIVLKDVEKVSKYGKSKIEHGPLNSKIFGDNPNIDWLRMLQVGDCYFDGNTHAAFADVVNKRAQQYEWKRSVSQLIEYMPKGQSAALQINITDKHMTLIGKKEPLLFNKLAQQLNYPWLCNTLQKHYLALLNDEIKVFETADLPQEADGMLDHLTELRNKAQKFDDNTCLVRVGFGTGYRNMTGDWVRKLADDDAYSAIHDEIRRDAYFDYPLPKSRKFMFDGQFMGYLQLQFNY